MPGNKPADQPAPRLKAASGDAGESEAIEALYREFMGPLVRFLRHKFGPGPPEPEDLAQAAFSELVQRGNWREIRDHRAYLRRTASNAAISEHRARGVREHILHPVTEEHENRGSETRLENVFADRDLLLKVLALIEKLPRRQRRAFELSRFDELSLTEIAKREGISRTAVRKHVTNAAATIDRYLASLNL
ncbi:MAG: sigma-70 family RNA polymerase sigma factor [Pseudomonadota bacterium]